MALVADDTVPGVVVEWRWHASTVRLRRTQDRRRTAASELLRTSDDPARTTHATFHRVCLVQGVARLTGASDRRPRLSVCRTAQEGRRKRRKADVSGRTVADVQRDGHSDTRRTGARPLVVMILGAIMSLLASISLWTGTSRRRRRRRACRMYSDM